jgi:hypothetical protein
VKVWRGSGAALRELRIRVEREAWNPGGPIARLEAAIESNPAFARDEGRRILRDVRESLGKLAIRDRP